MPGRSNRKPDWPLELSGGCWCGSSPKEPVQKRSAWTRAPVRREMPCIALPWRVETPRGNDVVRKVNLGLVHQAKTSKEEK